MTSSSTGSLACIPYCSFALASLLAAVVAAAAAAAAALAAGSSDLDREHSVGDLVHQRAEHSALAFPVSSAEHWDIQTSLAAVGFVVVAQAFLVDPSIDCNSATDRTRAMEHPAESDKHFAVDSDEVVEGRELVDVLYGDCRHQVEYSAVEQRSVEQAREPVAGVYGPVGSESVDWPSDSDPLYQLNHPSAIAWTSA